MNDNKEKKEEPHKNCAHCGDTYWVESSTLGAWAKHICTPCAAKILKSRIRTGTYREPNDNQG